MANRIEGFDEAILDSAKREFMEKGYADASIRRIAVDAGVSTSTIYTRYGDKEGLFSTLVEPASSSMIAYLSLNLDTFSELPIEEQKEKKSYSDHVFRGLTDLIYGHFDEFRLLVTCAPENFFYNFLETLARIDMDFNKRFLAAAGSRPYLQGRFSDDFLHVLSTSFYAGVFEVVVHDMEREDAEDHIMLLRRFYDSGWRDLI